MKKVFTVLALSVLLISLSSNSSQAQFSLRVGPQAGLNFNIQSGSDVTETTNGFGALIGAQVDMNFTPVIGLMANMQFYDNRYASYSVDATTDNGTPYTETLGFSMAYFMIEPLFKVTVPNSNFFFFIGPSLGFPVQSSWEDKVTSSSANVTFGDGATKHTGTIRNTSTRFEMKLGSGIDINLGGVILAPQFSFGYGLSNIVEDSEAKILTFQLLSTVKFPL
ncbi:MAG: outer membrane beta-barrel protein [Bacteroidota bacterium]|nr:PorT family protein [Ignavibacteria bacterium]MCU7524487.1 PorT family protein [Ignavibacteria bacterium]HEX2962118.1 outer membrane beta-barrel protein [Ignavibacteriales bacterium]